MKYIRVKLHRPYQIVGIFLLISYASTSHASDELLEEFKRELSETVDYGGRPRTPARTAILEHGPNMLLPLSTVLAKEKSWQRFEYEVLDCFMIISAIDIFHFDYKLDQEHGIDRRMTYDASDPRSFFSPSEGGDLDIDAKLLDWWSQRDSFLDRIRCERFQRITFDGQNQIFKLDESITVELAQQFGVYGIYAIPCYVKMIREEDSPVALIQFFRVTRNYWVYGEYGKVKVVDTVQEAYPTLEKKMSLVCAWWEEAAPTFTELAELHAAIDKEIRAYCAESEVDEAPSLENPDE